MLKITRLFFSQIPQTFNHLYASGNDKKILFCRALHVACCKRKKVDEEKPFVCPKPKDEPPKEEPPKPTICKPQKPCKVMAFDENVKTKLKDVCVYEPCKQVCDVNICTPEPPSKERIPPEADPTPTPFDANVVIIGAGMSGLSAAQRLIHAGVKNVVLLEASNRPGGRIRSMWIKDVVVELGSDRSALPEWNNPIMDVAMTGNLLSRPLSKVDPSKGLFRESDGRPLSLPISYQTYLAVNKILKEHDRLLNYVGYKTKGAMSEFIGVRIQQELRKYPKDLSMTASRVMVGLVNAIMQKYGEDKNFISNDILGTYAQIPGAQIQIPLGFVGELSPLLKAIGTDRILYKKVVQTIKWGAVSSNDTAPRAIVKCIDGSEFPATYVLVTCPLGVIKANADTLFCPSLPAKKVEAIKYIRYEHVNKIFFEYDRPFWSWRYEPIQITWSCGDLSKKSGWLGGLSKLEETWGSNYVLTAVVKGELPSIALEQSNDDDIIDSVTGFLKQYLGDPKIPKPVRVVKTSWSGDKNYLGAYSLLDSERSLENSVMQSELLAPIPLTGDTFAPIIYFAGEATCDGLHATVHGARLSGIREAERLIRIIKKIPSMEVDDICTRQEAAMVAQVCSG